MNEKMKKTMKRSLALMLALILVIGAGTWMRDGRLKADEEAPEAEVVVEEAAPAEAPAPAPVEEPAIVVQEVTLPAEEPKVEAEAEAVDRSAEAVEEAEEPKAEEPAEEAAPAEEEKAPFDVREAYEHYMSLGSDEEKASYLDSLDAADRKALEDYIAEKELEAAGAAVMFAAAPAEEEQEAEAEAEADKAEAEAPEDTSFGSAKVSGEWAGRDTSATRSLTVEVYVDGVLADSCSTEMNMSVAEFSVALGDCTVESESSSCGAFSGNNGTYKVDMYADTSATVTVMLLSPVVELPKAALNAALETAEPSDGNSDEQEDEVMVIITADTPVREKADGLSDIFADLPVDAEVKLIGIEGDWLHVVTEDGMEGYIFRADTNNREEPSAEPEMKVTIFADRRASIAPGEVITLSSRLEGFEDCEYVLFQWECNKGKGNGWEEVPGATGDTYSFTFSDETNHTTWRLRVISD